MPMYLSWSYSLRGRIQACPTFRAYKGSLIELRLGEAVIMVQCTSTFQNGASVIAWSPSFLNCHGTPPDCLLCNPAGFTNCGPENSIFWHTLKPQPEGLTFNQPATGCWLRSLSLEHRQVLAYPQQLRPIKKKSCCWDNHRVSRDN